MSTKYYHYTSIENAQRIKSEMKFRLKNINHTNDHSEGYQFRIEELYPDLQPKLGKHYEQFQKYRNQQPQGIFFGSLTTEHLPSHTNNPLWRKYGISNDPNQRVKFGKGACIEMEFMSIPEINQFNFCNINNAICSINNICYLPFSPKDIDFQINFELPFLENFKTKEFSNKQELKLNLKFLAWGFDYLFKSLIHKCEAEIRLLCVYENLQCIIDRDLVDVPLQLTSAQVHLHPLYDKKK